MTFDEAIKHIREISAKNRKKFEELRDSQNYVDAYKYFKCFKDYERLANWLEELKADKEGGS